MNGGGGRAFECDCRVCRAARQRQRDARAEQLDALLAAETEERRQAALELALRSDDPDRYYAALRAMLSERAPA